MTPLTPLWLSTHTSASSSCLCTCSTLRASSSTAPHRFKAAFDSDPPLRLRDHAGGACADAQPPLRLADLPSCAAGTIVIPRCLPLTTRIYNPEPLVITTLHGLCDLSAPAPRDHPRR
eukprot:596996-Rhodomonas_salina.3